MCPKISIITITFNSENTVEETIKSVVSQDYGNVEYIIIDGGSKDGTLDILNRYRDKIAKVVSEPDEGISDAFNKGIKNVCLGVGLAVMLGIIMGDFGVGIGILIICIGIGELLVDYFAKK